MIKSYKQVDIDTTTSLLLKEYLKFKIENPDSILFFQIGEFFEVFFEDAQTFSKITGLTLSSRKIKDMGEILQAGIPKKSIDFYIKQLLNENLKVCLCIQYQDEDDEFHRKIIRKFTKGTIVEDEFLEISESNYILALFLNENNSISLSYSDVSVGHLYKTQINKSDLEVELAKIFPNEILISKSQKEIFVDVIKNFNVTILNDDCFNYPIDEVIKNYCKKNQLNFTVELSKPDFYNYNKFMMMDQITRNCLELTRTRYLLKKKGSLLWFLNYTKTPMGLRLLKKWLSEPLLVKDEIKQRQDAVFELINSDKIDKLQTIFENFCDLARMNSLISNSTIKPKDLLKIAHCAMKLGDLDKICSKFKSDLLKFDKKNLKAVLEFAAEIIEAIDVDDNAKLGAVIKEGYNSNLDYLKTKLIDTQKEMAEYEKSERKKLNIEKLKISYMPSIGYYIELPLSKKINAPFKYSLKHSTSTCVRYSTEELYAFEEELGNLNYKISQIEAEIYKNLKSFASKFVLEIRELAKNIAQLDVLVAFSKCAEVNKLSCPKFLNDGINIKNGFHPSLLKLKNEVIKNDTDLKNGAIIVLTGANMSGKSTYLKQNAVITLLAQIGSFVPSDNANLTIVDRLFIRQGATDDIINNNSTFMVEMNDLKYILDNATKNSYILLDEPAKSTNAKEGSAIARAFLEYILKYYKTKTIVSTHNLELTKLENIYPDSVFNYVIGSLNDDFDIQNRRIKRGKISSSYALNTAELASLPAELINNAKNYLN